MALEGSLTDFGLADILQLIYFQRKTGILTLEGRMDKIKLLFVEGNIVGAESKRRIDDNRLGKILLKRGLITESDLRAALDEHKKTKAKLGTIIIQKEFVDKEVITEIINSQITETVIQLFNWKQGTYEFTAQGVPPDKVLSTSLDTQHLLMDGLRIVDEWSVIRGRITLDTIFRSRGEGSSDLDENEVEILKYVDGENDVSTIIDLSGGDNFEVSKTLLSLVEKGVVEAVESAPIVSEAEAFATRKPLPLLRFLAPATVCISLVLSLTVVAVNKGGLSKEFRAGGKIDTLRFKIEVYKMEHSAYPPTLDAVSLERDPWGHPYIYKASGSSFYLASAGADGKEGTGDDIY
jgi:hypothetical protein